MKPLVNELNEIKFFENFSNNHLEKIANLSIIKEFKVEEVLFEQYSELTELYILIEGSLSLGIKIHNKRIHLSSIEEGQLFSWTAFFKPYISTAWVKAVKPVKVIAIDARNLKNEIKNSCSQKDCEFGFKLMEKIAQTISHRLNDTRYQLMNQLEL